MLSLLLEAITLMWNTTPTPANMITQHVFTHTEHPYPPDNWWNSSNQHWATVTVWSLISWVLPFFFSCCIAQADTLSFNVGKAILVHGTYRLTAIPHGSLDEYSFTAFHLASGFKEGFYMMCDRIPGGHNGLLLGAIAGIVARLIDMSQHYQKLQSLG